MDAAGLRLPGIGQHRSGQFELRFGERVGGRGSLEIRCRIVARVETVGIGGRQMPDGGLGPTVTGAVLDPKRRESAARVERLNNGALLLATENAVGLAAEKVAHLLG